LRRINLKAKLMARMALAIFSIIAMLSYGCVKHKRKEVVVYTSVDEEYSKPIFQKFEKAHNVIVKPVYDVEATKSAGLANRIIAEKANPQADVFWSGECLRIIDLKQKGTLEEYESPAAADIPLQFKDPQSFWTGFAGRVRVIIYNKALVRAEDAPKSIYDFADSRFLDKIAIANPLFGTTTFHFISLFITLGENEALDFFGKLKKNKVRIVDGNSVVRKMVETGEIEMGLTDSDDAELSLSAGNNIGIIYPDQYSFGTPFMPNMVALIRNGPNPDNGKLFIDYLLSKKADEMLISSKWTKLSVRDVLRENNRQNIKVNIVNYEQVSSIAQYVLTKIKKVINL
jgi:iron(III) transport system substrate-binding protein